MVPLVSPLKMEWKFEGHVTPSEDLHQGKVVNMLGLDKT
jgi:hypothetical protein